MLSRCLLSVSKRKSVHFIETFGGMHSDLLKQFSSLGSHPYILVILVGNLEMEVVQEYEGGQRG